MSVMDDGKIDQEAGAQVRRRSGRKRRRRPMPYPLRIALVASAGMAFAWVLFQVMVKVVHPYKLGFEEGRRVADISAQLKKQEDKNKALKREIAYLVSPEGRESAARRAHYRVPGEMVYLLPQPTPSPIPTPEVP
jgi:hypothetical protein